MNVDTVNLVGYLIISLSLSLRPRFCFVFVLVSTRCCFFFVFCAFLQLIQKKVDLNAVDGDGWTALMYAVSVGAAEAVSRLIAAGVDTSIKNSDGDTAMDMCKASKKRHALIQLIDPKEPMPTVAE